MLVMFGMCLRMQENPTACQTELLHAVSLCAIGGVRVLCGYQGQPGVGAGVYVAIGPAVLIHSLTAVVVMGAPDEEGRRRLITGFTGSRHAYLRAWEGAELTPNAHSIGLIHKSQSKVSHEGRAWAHKAIWNVWTSR